MTSVDAAERWAGASSSMTVNVEPDQLLTLAESFDQIADRAQRWVDTRSDALTFPPMGSDEVSVAVASWMGDNATGYGGLVPALQKAVAELRSAAAAMRESAASYGYTDEANAGGVSAAGGRA